MTFFEFLSDRLSRLLLTALFMVIVVFFLHVTGTQSGVLIILIIACSLIFATIQVTDYFNRCSRLKELDAIMNQLDEKYLFIECVPKPRGNYERKIFELLHRSSKSMIETVSNAQTAQREYREYIESWVHEVKTPITAAQLICQNADKKTRHKLTQELAQIDNHVERALFYARVESLEKDFIIHQTNLAEIVAQAIERHRTLLIQHGVRIETDGLDCIVYADNKWVCFMLGQLLQNALRYRSESPVITLTAKQLGNQVQLTVQDNGIGIPLHELPRVFERGFTGSNGRSRGGSTGMGLYLCRRLATSLEIDIQIKSEEHYGTSVQLTFPAKGNLSKV